LGCSGESGTGADGEGALYVYGLSDYAASTAAGDFKRTAEEQHIEEATKTFASATLNGVRSVDRYKDEKKGIYYVVVKMDLEDVKDMLTQSNELNSQMRDFVRKNADRAFERLEKEEQKRGNGAITETAPISPSP
jgi:hypothetical protein